MKVRAALILLLLVSVSRPDAARADRVAERRTEAEGLYRHARLEVAHHTFEGRHIAIDDLERATLLDPQNPEYELTLARTYYQCGFLKSARTRLERVIRMSPANAEARLRLGLVWRRDWLKYLDGISLTRAVVHLSAAARLEPDSSEAWIALTPLLVEQKDLRAAHAAAENAFSVAPERPEARLAVAYTAYRLGLLDLAENAFEAALPGLDPRVRERFDDISPIASEVDTTALRRLPPERRPEFVRRFWKDNDPDLATAVNEAQLEYWSRVAQAYFLFYDSRRHEWDERGEVYVRYGAPDKAEYNPVGEAQHASTGQNGDFPCNMLAWDYSSLGMHVVLQDRTLNEFYLLPITMDYDPDPLPDPDSLARHAESVAARSGRAVFPALPPGALPLHVEGAVARFEGESGGRLLGQLEAPGGPADSLTAEWVVLDSTREEVARARRSLSPSACEALDRRVADFAAELPPGEYSVGLSVHDQASHRGSFRETVQLAPVARTLALSDVVVSCGTPPPGGNAVRIDANPSARVRGDDPLTAYFEIYHLRPGAAGSAHFQYVYTVKSAETDPRIWLLRAFAPRRVPPEISATRQEEQVGELRRQFVTVPVKSLPAGRYRLEIRVRDLVAGEDATAAAEFVKVAAPPLRN